MERAAHARGALSGGDRRAAWPDRSAAHLPRERRAGLPPAADPSLRRAAAVPRHWQLPSRADPAVSPAAGVRGEGDWLPGLAAAPGRGRDLLSGGVGALPAAPPAASARAAHGARSQPPVRALAVRLRFFVPRPDRQPRLAARDPLARALRALQGERSPRAVRRR